MRARASSLPKTASHQEGRRSVPDSTRRLRSPSLTMPASRPSLPVTGTALMPRSSSSFAMSSTFASGGTTTAGVVLRLLPAYRLLFQVPWPTVRKKRCSRATSMRTSRFMDVRSFWIGRARSGRTRNNKGIRARRRTRESAIPRRSPRSSRDRRIAQQRAQEERDCKHGGSREQQGATDPHAPLISAPALYVHELEVCVNRTCEFRGMRLDRHRRMDDEPKRLGASVLGGKVDDIVFSVASERFLVLIERRGAQRIEQLLDALDPDIDGCQLASFG